MSAEPSPPAAGGRPSRLTAVEVALVHVSSLLVGGTGCIYAVMVYLLSPADEFAVVNHPAQPLVQHLHVLAAPLFLLALGIVWRAHARAMLGAGVRARRASGLAVLGVALPMVLSGYFLQVASAAGWRTAWSAVHTAVSLAWLAALLLHVVARRDGATR